MSRIIRCTEVTDEEIYRAFAAGFSDYMIPMTMDQPLFIDRFFGPEGNDRNLSCIAVDEDNNPLGANLGGLKTNESIKTLRCGGMCIVPGARGTGLAYEMMNWHFSEAKRIGCEQLHLEVISSNDRAFNFYKKLGYEKVYDISYRTLHRDDNIRFRETAKCDFTVEPLPLSDLKKIRNSDFSHLPWQYCFEYFQCLDTKCFGVNIDDLLVAGLVAWNSKILYLWVHPDYRRIGMATAMISRMISDDDPEKVTLAYANNSDMHNFANRNGMKLENIAQFEMYKQL